MADFTIVKFSPNGAVHPVTDPMPHFTDWGSAEVAALAAQQGNTDGSQFAIVMAVAVTSYTVQPVQLNLLGATVPTTV